MWGEGSTTSEEPAPTKTDAETYTPVVTAEVVENGGTIDLTDNISGIPTDAVITDLSSSSINTTVAGDYTATVKVTYPDGSNENVDISVTVKEKPTTTEAEKYTPKVTAIVVGKGESFTPKDYITDIPENAVIAMISGINTNTPGSYTAIVRVIYSDNSSDVVNIPVTVKDSSTTVPTDVTWKKLDDGRNWLIHTEPGISYEVNLSKSSPGFIGTTMKGYDILKNNSTLSIWTFTATTTETYIYTSQIQTSISVVKK